MLASIGSGSFGLSLAFEIQFLYTCLGETYMTVYFKTVSSSTSVFVCAFYFVLRQSSAPQAGLELTR